MPAPVCLIVNPAAGGGRAGRVAPAVLGALSGWGLRVERWDAADCEHARALAREAATRGSVAAVLGGDGLAGAAAEALRDVPGAVLGVLPAGRGNDLARVLGIGADPIAACETIARGVPMAMDVGEVRRLGADGQPYGASRAFVGIASAGFDSDANRIANEASPRLGELVYAYGALRALVRWRPARFHIELDPPGSRYELCGYSIAAANSQAYGGGMRLAPHALLDDGLLDVVAIEHIARLRLLMCLPRVFRGSHLQMANVRELCAEVIDITASRPFTLYADGDPIFELPVRVRAVRAALEVLVRPDRTTGVFGASPRATRGQGQAASVGDVSGLASSR